MKSTRAHASHTASARCTSGQGRPGCSGPPGEALRAGERPRPTGGQAGSCFLSPVHVLKDC